MNEQPPLSLDKTPDNMQDALDMQDAAKRARERFIDTPAKEPKSGIEIAKDVASVALIVGTGVAVGIVGGHAVESQTDHTYNQNKQWSDDANHNTQQQEFDKGLDNGKVTIETTPAPLPVPLQIGIGEASHIDNEQLETK